MRLRFVRCFFALLAVLAACGPDYDGGGRRSELPVANAGGAAGAAGTAGIGGFGLSGSSDSGVDTGLDAGSVDECPVDANYMIDTGVGCTDVFPVGTRCRRDDGAECLCSPETLMWACE